MNASVGSRIKALRTQRGLSQDELASRMNARFGTAINKGMISKWENGLGEPRLETAKQLALFFHMSLDALLGIEDERDGASAGGSDWHEPSAAAGEEGGIGEPDEPLSEERILTLAAHQVGHVGKLTEEQLAQIKLAMKIALAKEL